VTMNWYSETRTNGVAIQNSYPKGGRCTQPLENKFNCSYLVFFTRVENQTNDPLELSVTFSPDPIPIPHSSETFMRLVLPTDTMTLEKQSLSSYGITELPPLNASPPFKRTLNPQEDCLFYVVAIFYQTEAGKWSQERGGNRAELVLKGQDLFYKMPPQIPSLLCGHITLSK
ncbi:MAG: hypothetical protein AAFY41_19295, partial [Bacteroidota bacterium]